MGFYKKLEAYLSQPVAERDITEGANLLLQINRNRILHQNIITRPEKHKKKLFYELEKYAKMHSLSVKKEELTFDAEKSAALGKEADKRIAKGKRKDHDELPEDIQRLWVDNAELRAKMRSFHEKAKASEKECDRKEAVYQLIEADKQYRKNWELYDGYVIGKETEKPKATANKEESKNDETPVIDARRVSANRKYLSTNKEKLNTLKDSEDQAKYAKLLKEVQKRYDELESSGNSVSDEQKQELSSLGIVL